MLRERRPGLLEPEPATGHTSRRFSAVDGQTYHLLQVSGYNDLPTVLSREAFEQYDGATIHGFHGEPDSIGKASLLSLDEQRRYGDFFERTTDPTWGTVIYRGKKGTGFPADRAMVELQCAPPDQHYIGSGAYGNGISFGPREVAMRYASRTVGADGFPRFDDEVVEAVLADLDLVTPERALVRAKIAPDAVIVSRTPKIGAYLLIDDIAEEIYQRLVGSGAAGYRLEGMLADIGMEGRRIVDALLFAVRNGIDGMVNTEYDFLLFNRAKLVLMDVKTRL